MFFSSCCIEVTETHKIIPSNQALAHAQVTEKMIIQTEHATSLGIIQHSGLPFTGQRRYSHYSGIAWPQRFENDDDLHPHGAQCDD